MGVKIAKTAGCFVMEMNYNDSQLSLVSKDILFTSPIYVLAIALFLFIIQVYFLMCRFNYLFSFRLLSFVYLFIYFISFFSVGFLNCSFHLSPSFYFSFSSSFWGFLSFFSHFSFFSFLLFLSLPNFLVCSLSVINFVSFFFVAVLSLHGKKIV